MARVEASAVSYKDASPSMSIALPGFVIETLIVLTVLFVFMVGTAVLAIVILFIVDVTQTKHAIRRNYPVIGRFRYLFEHLGTFFRQYFFAMDREEMPFNRAQRNYVYRAAKNVDTTVAEDLMIVLKLASDSRKYPGDLGFEPEISAIWQLWRGPKP